MTATRPEAGRPATSSENPGLDPAAMNQLNSVEARTLLDTIDAIHELQVGEAVNSPQIIVVGNRSAGKSSVLEAISRVRFPIKSGLCTRFAIEVVLRKATQQQVSVSIKWADERSRDSQSQDHLGCARFDKDALPKLILQAEEKMGLVGSVSQGLSKDILRVEITGPDVYPLTLVDLPGLRGEMDDQTLKGKAIAEQLADDYMKQKNSIILAVVSANDELANQTVLERAKLHDPTRERTIGVVTKPDLAGAGSSNEQNWLRLINGHDKAHKVALGWHVLRNPPQQEQDASADDRDAEEDAFFSGSTWESISRWRRGAGELRKKLSKALLDHIRRSLPKVVSEIEEGLRDREKRLERVGKNSREAPDEMRPYLLEIADQFQKLARDGVEGRYAHPFFGGLYDDRRKVRAQLRNLNRAFAATLLSKGAKYNILSGAAHASEADEGGNDAFPEFLQPFLGLFSRFPCPQPITEKELCQKLDLLASINRGTELPGAPNSDLALQLFREQVKPWRDIATRHLHLVSDYAKSFVEQLIEHIIAGSADPESPSAESPTTSRMVAAVLRELVDPFFEAKAETLCGKLDELLRPYTTGLNMPLEPEFRGTMSKRTAVRRTKRVVGPPQDKTGDHSKTPGDRHKEIWALESFEGPHGDGDSTTESLIDMMLTYYEMSLRTFMDNVINLAIENCLICDIPSILTPSKVIRMDEKTLRNLGQESDEIREERERLRRETKFLRQSLQKCRLYRPRQPSVLPTHLPSVAASMSSSSRNASNMATGQRHIAGGATETSALAKPPSAEPGPSAKPSSTTGSGPTPSAGAGNLTTPKSNKTLGGNLKTVITGIAAKATPPTPAAGTAASGSGPHNGGFLSKPASSAMPASNGVGFGDAQPTGNPFAPSAANGSVAFSSPALSSSSSSPAGITASSSKFSVFARDFPTPTTKAAASGGGLFGGASSSNNPRNSTTTVSGSLLFGFGSSAPNSIQPSSTPSVARSGSGLGPTQNPGSSAAVSATQGTSKTQSLGPEAVPSTLHLTLDDAHIVLACANQPRQHEKHCHISHLTGYSGFSPEEIRLQDYSVMGLC